jgi:hypothetical protein
MSQTYLAAIREEDAVPTKVTKACMQNVLFTTK